MDYQTWYENLSRPFRQPQARRALNICDKALVYIVAAAYLAWLAALAATSDIRFWKALLVPAATFALVTAIRAGIDAPRPYELYPIDPLIAKDTHGKSFPSRHLSSAAVIALTMLWLDPLQGVIACLAACAVAFTRLVGGVHFPRDIIAGIVIPLACSIIGFLLVPLP